MSHVLESGIRSAMPCSRSLIGLLFSLLIPLSAAQIPVRISWGHASPKASYYLRISPETDGVLVRDVQPEGLESGDELKDGAWQTSAGAGDVDGLRFNLEYPDQPKSQLQNLQIIWADLIANSDADTARRLGDDPAFHPDTSKLTIFTSRDGDRGFSVSTDQLLKNRALWIPSLDMYISAGETPVPFEEHLRELSAWKGMRVLDQVHANPEATYELYKTRWQDMGSPFYVHPQEPDPGHIVGLTWDSAIAKFGIDRAAGVRNDYGNPDHFQFWFDFASLSQGVLDSWKEQHLADGLPVITTTFEKGRIRYEVEQFAYPLNGPPSERRGDIPMVLMQKVKLTNLEGVPRKIPITLNERRLFPSYLDTAFVADRSGGQCLLFRDSAYRQVVLGIQGVDNLTSWAGVADYQKQEKRLNATVTVDLPAKGSREFIVKLPSPSLAPEDTAKFSR